MVGVLTDRRLGTRTLRGPAFTEVRVHSSLGGVGKLLILPCARVVDSEYRKTENE